MPFKIPFYIISSFNTTLLNKLKHLP